MKNIFKKVVGIGIIAKGAVLVVGGGILVVFVHGGHGVRHAVGHGIIMC